MKHIISTKQFSNKDFLEKLFQLADEMEKNDKENKLTPILKGKILANLFYEPSTRTRFSFESAMQKLGGSVISTENALQFSSAIKGESLPDTIKTVNNYADIIVLRHFEKGSAKIASEASAIPLINAGDGTGEHPTQALLDLYTIKKELGKLDNLKIAMVGDLLYGRTVHSLLQLLTLYNVEIFLISPSQLKLPDEYKEILKEKGIKFQELTDLKKILNIVDVLYITRIQKERFKSEEEYNAVKGVYIINKNLITNLKENAIIMHPLPRVNEISTEIDKDKRAAYFRQAKNGLYIRMALLQIIFEKN